MLIARLIAIKIYSRYAALVLTPFHIPAPTNLCPFIVYARTETL